MVADVTLIGDTMLDMAKVTPEDYAIDLGSGDGRLVIAAAKRGVRALGIEYNADLVVLSRANAAKEGVAEKASFIKGDIFESDFPDATVIMMFLSPAINLKLRPKLLSLKPGTRVVTNTFVMGEWSPDEKIRCGRKLRVHLLLCGLSLDCAGERGRHVGDSPKANSRLSKRSRLFPGRSNPAPPPCPSPTAG